MKKNDLSVWTFSYRRFYYLTHPWKWFKDLYWNIRNFWHRGRYGYAYVDVWNWYHWWPKVGAEALRYLANHNSGYPGFAPWETPEEWRSYLLKTVDKLDWSAKSCEMGPEDHKNKNEYWEEFEEKLLHDFKRSKTEEKQMLLHKYWEREEELSKEDDKERARIFAEIGKNLGRFWD